MRTIAVIMAGGRGERLLPLTSLTPKPLVVLHGQPLIASTLQMCANVVLDATFVIGCHQADQVEAYVRNNWPRTNFLRDPELLNTGGSLKWHLPSIAASDPDNLLFLVCDHLRQLDLNAFLQHHIRCGNDLTLLTSPPSDENEHVLLRDEKVVGYIPFGAAKPRKGGQSAVGEHLLRWPVLVRQLAESGERRFDFTCGVVIPLIEKPQVKVGVYQIGVWQDVGTLERYRSQHQ